MAVLNETSRVVEEKNLFDRVKLGGMVEHRSGITLPVIGGRDWGSLSVIGGDYLVKEVKEVPANVYKCQE